LRSQYTHGSDLQNMVAQTHFFNAETGARTTGGQVDNEIKLQRAANVHGLRAEFNIESEAMEANSNGQWVVYAFPGDIISSADYLGGWAGFDDENITQYIWGAGLWMASNQTPMHIEFAPGTSRNMKKGSRIVATLHVEGTVPVLTQNRVNILLSFFVGN